MILRPLELQDADMIAGWAADPDFSREADWADDLPFTERRGSTRRSSSRHPLN